MWTNVKWFHFQYACIKYYISLELRDTNYLFEEIPSRFIFFGGQIHSTMFLPWIYKFPNDSLQYKYKQRTRNYLNACHLIRFIVIILRLWIKYTIIITRIKSTSECEKQFYSVYSRWNEILLLLLVISIEIMDKTSLFSHRTVYERCHLKE